MDGHKQIWNYIPKVRWEGPLLNFVKGPLTFASESSLDGPETAERVYPQQRARQHSSKKKQSQPCSSGKWNSSKRRQGNLLHDSRLSTAEHVRATRNNLKEQRY